MTIFNKNLENADIDVQPEAVKAVISDFQDFKESVEIVGIWPGDMDEAGVSFVLSEDPARHVVCPRCGEKDDVNIGTLQFTYAHQAEEECDCPACGFHFVNVYDISYDDSYTMIDC